MKAKIIVGLVAALFIIAGAPVFAQTDEDIGQHANCKYCGMDRQKFAHSRMLIEYEDGTVTGTCSLHCTAIELAVNIDKTPKRIQVGDYGTKKLIEAESACWVIGGEKPGVMTKQGKWAFAGKEGCEAFVKESGGTQASFDEAMEAAYRDMFADTKMIREKRKMMKQKMQSEQKPKE
jgi:copper chaperone NosL